MKLLPRCTLLPRSLAGRTISVLLAGLVVSNVVGLLIYAGERDTALSNIAGRKVAERIAGVARTLELTAPGTRAGAVCSHTGPGFAVTLTAQAAIDPGTGGWRLRLLRSTLSDLLDKPAPQRLRLASETRNHGEAPGRAFTDVLKRCAGATPQTQAMTQMMSRMMGPQTTRGGSMNPGMARMMRSWRSGDILRVSYRLDDGSWLNFITPAPKFSSLFQSRFLLAFLFMAVVVTGLSVWAVRRSTAPLALFAWAAERLGRDVNAPDLPEDGPREVNRAARAFNEMQRRLRRLIGDRTQMLAAISHDLRTPITRLRLRAEFVEDARQRAKMLNDLEEMEAMIAATLAFARSDSTDEPRQDLDLAALLQSVCQDGADGGQNVTFSGATRATYAGRPLALKRAFVNLVDNAVNYGGSARVALGTTHKNFVVTVEDDGPGIPENEMERVFDPFYRVEASRNRESGGTGLGLAIVRSIVRGHGGEITLANRQPSGLLATVVLPRG